MHVLRGFNFHYTYYHVAILSTVIIILYNVKRVYESATKRGGFSYIPVVSKCNSKYILSN